MVNMDSDATRVADRRRRAVELNAEGMTQRDIAAELGVSAAAVNGYLKDVRGLWSEESQQTIDAHIATDLRRIELAIGAVMRAILDKKTPNLNLTNNLVRLLDRKARLLGMDAPEKRQLTGADDGPILVSGDISDLLADLADKVAAETGVDRDLLLQRTISDIEEASGSAI